MKNVFTLTAVAAFAFAAHSAAACDWNREASAGDAVVAVDQATPPPTPTCTGPNCPAPKLASISSGQLANGNDNERAPIVSTNTRD
jgi:hypothetical protein